MREVNQDLSDAYGHPCIASSVIHKEDFQCITYSKAVSAAQNMLDSTRPREHGRLVRACRRLAYLRIGVSDLPAGGLKMPLQELRRPDGTAKSPARRQEGGTFQ